MPLLRALRPQIRLSGAIQGLGRRFDTQSPCWRQFPLQTRSKHVRSTPQSNRKGPAPDKRQRALAPKSEKLENNQHETLEKPFVDWGTSGKEIPGQVRHPVRYARPALWAVSASVGIYVFLAYLEARKEPQDPRAFQRRPFRPQESADPKEVLTQYWADLNPISKLTYGIIAANGAVHLGSLLPLSSGYWSTLWHTPMRNVNYTLFTSTFVHSGPMHLLVNMWACYNFLLPVGYSRLFEGSPYHTLSFFLATGVLSGYAQHFSNLFENTSKTLKAGKYPGVVTPSGGASGALFGIFAAFCMQYPDANVGIILIPFSFAASKFLPCVMAFDLYGMVRGFSSLNFGHAAHLSGALIGIAYSTFDGNNKIWKPLVRFFKRRRLERNLS